MLEFLTLLPQECEDAAAAAQAASAEVAWGLKARAHKWSPEVAAWLHALHSSSGAAAAASPGAAQGPPSPHQHSPAAAQQREEWEALTLAVLGCFGAVSAQPPGSTPPSRAESCPALRPWHRHCRTLTTALRPPVPATCCLPALQWVKWGCLQYVAPHHAAYFASLAGELLFAGDPARGLPFSPTCLPAAVDAASEIIEHATEELQPLLVQLAAALPARAAALAAAGGGAAAEELSHVFSLFVGTHAPLCAASGPQGRALRQVCLLGARVAAGWRAARVLLPGRHGKGGWPPLHGLSPGWLRRPAAPPHLLPAPVLPAFAGPAAAAGAARRARRRRRRRRAARHGCPVRPAGAAGGGAGAARRRRGVGRGRWGGRGRRRRQPGWRRQVGPAPLLNGGVRAVGAVLGAGGVQGWLCRRRRLRPRGRLQRPGDGPSCLQPLLPQAHGPPGAGLLCCLCAGGSAGAGGAARGSLPVAAAGRGGRHGAGAARHAQPRGRASRVARRGGWVGSPCSAGAAVQAPATARGVCLRPACMHDAASRAAPLSLLAPFSLGACPGSACPGLPCRALPTRALALPTSRPPPPPQPPWLMCWATCWALTWR